MSTLPYDVVIFDLDGTLTESEPGIIQSVQYALDALGFSDYDGAMLRSFIGPPLFESFSKTLKFDDDTANRGIALYRERFSRVGWRENAVYTGIWAMLRSLKRSGTYVALATSKPMMFCEKILKHFGLFGFFDRVICASPNSEHSDKPELVKAALPESYRRACMVGDRKYDVEGALANGIEAIGVLYGYGTETELRAAGAHHIAATVSDLAALLHGNCPKEKGLFISLEGSDGCGKSTHVSGLADFLRSRGHDVLLTREPGGCPISERIRNVVLDADATDMTDLTEALLFAAARAQHVHDAILPALAQGKTVLCDRYVDSSIAYQGVGRGLGEAWVSQINAPAASACMPDLTILFDLNPEQALSRRIQNEAPDRIEQSSLDFVRKTYAFYRQLAQREPDRIRTFDASGTIEEVAQRLHAFTAALLDEGGQ